MDTTRMSENGQVVIPKSVREQLGLKPKDQFVIQGKGDMIVMKRLDADELWKEFEKSVKPLQEMAEFSGLTRQDVINAVREYRRENTD